MECRESSVAELQEREKTSRRITVIEHAQGEHYIVNMHSLHQPQLLWKIFGDSNNVRALTTDRFKLHTELATQLWDKLKKKAGKRKNRIEGVQTSGGKEIEMDDVVADDDDSDMEHMPDILTNGAY